MTPEDLAARHPRLYHQTAPDVWPSIQVHGLLPPRLLLERAGLRNDAVRALTHAPRPSSAVLENTPLGRVEINDNIPLSVAALERCLDDGLTPAQWCAMLAERVFFWTSESHLARLLSARTNRDRPRDVLVIDTLSLARAERARLELSPINSGSTIRQPARRGFSTYTPMREPKTYRDWAAQRQQAGQVKGLDRVKEVTVAGAVNIAPHVVERRRYEDGKDRVLG